MERIKNEPTMKLVILSGLLEKRFESLKFIMSKYEEDVPEVYKNIRDEYKTLHSEVKAVLEERESFNTIHLGEQTKRRKIK